MTQGIRVLIAKVGLDGHDRGAKVVARALRDAGFEVIYTGLFQTPDTVAAAAVDSDVLLVAGGVIPDEDLPALRDAGVAEIFLQETPPARLVARVRELVEAARSR